MAAVALASRARPHHHLAVAACPASLLRRHRACRVEAASAAHAGESGGESDAEEGLLLGYLGAVAAFGADQVEHEPPDHATYSPGKRPDLHIPELNLVVDAKTAHPLRKNVTPPYRSAASHTPFIATSDSVHKRSLGHPGIHPHSSGTSDPRTASSTV